MCSAQIISSVTSILVSETEQEVEVSLSVDVADGRFLNSVPNNSGPALASPVNAEFDLTYTELHEFIEAKGLHTRGIGVSDVVAIVMPNGAELALALVCCFQQTIAAPFAPSLSEAELVAAFTQLNVQHVLALSKYQAVDNHIFDAATTVGAKLHYMVSDATKAANIFWSDARGVSASPPSIIGNFSKLKATITSPECLDRTILVLRTSGTTSKPKLVPLTLHGLITGATCIAKCLLLTNADRCLNVMPLTHIAGISCSLLATMITGGCVVCTTGFDPNRMLDWLVQLSPTWFTAVPTMHKAIILLCGRHEPKHSLRFIRSGAAHLSDADARTLATIFKCSIYPTYSMSECMPIAQPPCGYALGKPGTVGLPISSSLRISSNNGKALAYGGVGEVCISGPVVIRSYLNSEQTNADHFFEDCGYQWFRTGDIGHLDGEGFLFLTGRSKELIKRGGEQVSPYEVEEVLMKHQAVEAVVVFGVPNDFWGEEVAAAAVLKPGCQVEANATFAKGTADIESSCSSCHVTPQALIAFATANLPSSKVPRQIKFVSDGDLPKSGTHKYQRAGLYKHLGVAAVDIDAQMSVMGEAAMSTVRWAQKRTDKPVKPHAAIYGIRFFLAIWVVFFHVGDFGRHVNSWRNTSLAMTCFFILAGFLLQSSVTRPVTSWKYFFRNRFIAAHPMLMMATIFAILVRLVKFVLGHRQPWPRELPQVAFLESDLAQECVTVMVGFVMSVYGCGILLIGTTWFSFIYYACILLFPTLHNKLSKWRVFNVWSDPTAPLCPSLCDNRFIRYFLHPLSSCVSFITLFNAASWAFVALMAGPKISYVVCYFLGLHMWLGILLCGMMTFNIFHFNARGDNRKNIWPYWGILTDSITCLFIMSLILQAVLLMADSSDGSLRQDTASLWAVEIYWREDVPLHLSIAAYWARPGRLAMPFLCTWIYGLAVGQGLTAKAASAPVMLKYLSPAAYPIYLFHWPIAELYLYLKIMAAPEEVSGNTGHVLPFHILKSYDFCIIVILTIFISVFVTNHLNAPATVLFQKFFPSLYCCCCCCRVGQDINSEQQSTLPILIEAIAGLTGAHAESTTLLTEIGLDSFGASALVGVLRFHIPGLQLTTANVYGLQTVGDLSRFIDAEGIPSMSC